MSALRKPDGIPEENEGVHQEPYPILSDDLVLPEEYLRRERASAGKHEYCAGRIHAMAGGSPNHNVICSNIIISVGSRLRGKPCRTYTSDQRVRATATAYCYPDVTIRCGEPRFDPYDTLQNPTVIFEVVSPTTEGYDRGEKFARYRLWSHCKRSSS